MDLAKIGDDANWINVAEGRDQSRASVNRVMNLREGGRGISWPPRTFLRQNGQGTAGQYESHLYQNSHWLALDVDLEANALSPSDTRWPLNV